MPLGLFHRVIAESGTANALWATNTDKTEERLMEEVNFIAQSQSCRRSTMQETIACLRLVPWTELLHNEKLCQVKCLLYIVRWCAYSSLSGDVPTLLCQVTQVCLFYFVSYASFTLSGVPHLLCQVYLLSLPLPAEALAGFSTGLGILNFNRNLNLPPSILSCNVLDGIIVLFLLCTC